LRQLNPPGLKRLHRSWNRRTEGRIGLLVDNVESPWNVGSITRTAAALRVDHLFVVGRTLSPSHPKVGKTAMGTERYLRWTTHETFAEAAGAAREMGYLVIGLELAEGAVPLFSLQTTAAVCLAVGNEDHGLSAAALGNCDRVGFIPQMGRVGSLNVATATAIGLYELRRWSWAALDPQDELDPHDALDEQEEQDSFDP
jgi:tRNA (guanosine-2'-O-)-methyltransferase